MSTITIEKVIFRAIAAPRWRRTARRCANVAVSLALFVLALELVKQGASALVPVLRATGVAGAPATLGLGWVMACLVLSGSPVAAVALALLAGGTLLPGDCFGMIVGSRLGASFVVLLVGALHDFSEGRREKSSAYIGAAALITTALTYLPAMALGLEALAAGWLEGWELEGRSLASLVSLLYGPITVAAARRLPAPLLFALGVFALLLAFRMIASALPEAASQQRRLSQARERLRRPGLLFAAGLAVTALTMSVSMSLSILVPLVAKGYLRREGLWAYILGANITTFDDTLFAAALVGHPDAVRIVALLAGSVTLVSIPLVFLAPSAFGRLVDRLAAAATRDVRALWAFVALVLAVPMLLVAL